MERRNSDIKIKVLIENMTNKQNMTGQHGLSMIIETDNKKILFDTGQNGDFIKNAENMGENLRDIDYAVISHGHYDHAGGLENFLRINKTAKIILSRNAMIPKYSKSSGEMRFIGFTLPEKIDNEIIYIEDYFRITESIEVYGNFKRKNSLEVIDKNLFMKVKEEYCHDTFDDEVYLTILKEDKLFLITGCAHKGIINVLREISDKKGTKYFGAVCGGLHLARLLRNQVDIIGKELANIGVEKLMVNHCTGVDSYSELKKIFGDSIKYMSTGETYVL